MRRPDVLFLNWRDQAHPEGGGSERYVHQVAEGLAARGWSVEILCAAHDRGRAVEERAGVRIVRRGGRLSVYAHGLAEVLRRRPRVVVDVHNGVPFLSTLVRRGPVVVLVHHVHREQWPLMFGRLGSALGWWLESRVAVWAYRRCRYVTVSATTARELAALGVAPERVSIVHNGTDPVPPAVAAAPGADGRGPRLIVVGRLVPHKRVEHAIEALVRLRADRPDTVLDVVGEGWWAPRLRELAVRRGVADAVRFHGFVDEHTKHTLLAGAWVHLCPSVKEGWGLVVLEAARHEVPTVAYRSAGGLSESVRDGETGVLADDHRGFVTAVRGLVDDRDRRAAMGAAAARYALRFDWDASRRAFAEVITQVTDRVRQRLPYSSTDTGGAAAAFDGPSTEPAVTTIPTPTAAPSSTATASLISLTWGPPSPDDSGTPPLP